MLAPAGSLGRQQTEGFLPLQRGSQLRMEAHETLGKHPWGWLRKGGTPPAKRWVTAGGPTSLLQRLCTGLEGSLIVPIMCVHAEAGERRFHPGAT